MTAAIAIPAELRGDVVADELVSFRDLRNARVAHSDRRLREMLVEAGLDQIAVRLPGRGGNRAWPASVLPYAWLARVRASRLVRALPTSENLFPNPAAGTTAADAWTAFNKATTSQQQRAETRFKALLRFDALLGEGKGREMALAIASSEIGHKPRVLREWLKIVRGAASRGDWLPLLLDDCKGRLEALNADERWFLQKVHDYHAFESRPSFAKAHQITTEIATALGRPVMRLQRCRSWYRKSVDQLGVLYAREGRDGIKHVSHKARRTKTHLQAMQIINGDGHLLDLKVRWRDGELKRATVFWFEDVKTGVNVGYHVCKSESAFDIGMAFCNVVSAHAIPLGMWVLLDNTLAADSYRVAGTKRRRGKKALKKLQRMKGIVELCGAEMRKTLPYSGESKPIERKHAMWLVNGVAKDPRCRHAYLGSNPLDKPAREGAADEIHIDDLLPIIAEHANWYNAENGRGERFRAELEQLKAEGKVHDVGTHLIERLKLWRTVKQVRSNASVHVLGNEYQDAELLVPYIGKLVIVEYPPEGATLHEGVRVYDASRDNNPFIGYIRCTITGGFDDPAVARETRRRQEQTMRAEKTAARNGRMQTPEEIMAERPRAAPLASTRHGAVIPLHPTPPAKRKKSGTDIAVTQSARDAAYAAIVAERKAGLG